MNNDGRSRLTFDFFLDLGNVVSDASSDVRSIGTTTSETDTKTKFV